MRAALIRHRSRERVTRSAPRLPVPGRAVLGASELGGQAGRGAGRCGPGRGAASCAQTGRYPTGPN
jgi:hypothetical protein